MADLAGATEREATHMLYLDDSGNKEYAPDGKYVGGGKTPLFVYGGLLMTPDEAGKISVAVGACKVGWFGTEDVEIKANWLKRPAERQKRYLDKYSLSDSDLTEFTTEIYDIIANCEADLVGVVVNKAEAQAHYGSRVWHASAIAYECLMQRVQMAMYDTGGYARIVIDDMDGASPAGRQWRTNLEAQHKQLRKSGSRMRRSGKPFDRLLGDEPTFKDSKHDHRLQLADLVAYCVYRQFIDHGPAWEDKTTGTLPMYEYFKRVSGRFRNHAGIITGYGIVKFPTVAKVLWQRQDTKQK